jgi:hypothetical protein
MGRSTSEAPKSNALTPAGGPEGKTEENAMPRFVRHRYESDSKQPRCIEINLTTEASFGVLNPL